MKLKKALLGCILAFTVAVGVIVPNAGELFPPINNAAGELFPPINGESITLTVEDA